MNAERKKPSIVWMEGLLDLFNAPFPHDKDDPRQLGFNIGRQMLGLYIVEMLLKYALDDLGTPHGSNHNLSQLFRHLPRAKRRRVERKYTEILTSRKQQTWDVARSAESLLQYLGKNPITDTRYFWEPDRHHFVEHASILVIPNEIHTLLFALFIVLHNYPSEPIVKRYNTQFIPLRESLLKDKGSP